jgi:serine/threonine-protein kinase
VTLEAGSTIDGRYRIVSPLGEGGMGAVYVVEHIAMRKRMALKVLHREMGDNPEVRARFEREAIAAAHIDHPNVVAASDFGRAEDGSFFMVLEYVEGRSLRSALENGPLGEARALALLRQMVAAVTRAHELGVVHRDLKPENVMLVTRDGVEQVKVLDFGIAKLQGELAESTAKGSAPLTQLGVVFGTPEYISPEQAQGNPVDARADLYALGVIAFEMIAGRRPFEADEPVRLLLMHANDPAPPLESASPAVAQIVARLLEKDPAARFPDARALGAALDALTGAGTPAPVSVSAPLVTGPMPVSGVAPTVVGTVPPASAPVSSALPSAARGLSKPVLAAIAAVALVVPLVVLGVIVNRLRHGDTTTSATTSSAPKPAPTERSIDDDDVRAAATKGSAALEALAAKAPKDPRIQRALVTAYTQEDDHVRAMDTLGKWSAFDSTAATDPAVEPAVLAAVTGKPADLDAALDVLEGPLGATGVDLLLELEARPGLNATAKKKLGQSLAKPEVKAHASAAAAIAIELKTTKSCDARYAMLERVKTTGDERALTILEAMQSKKGCGFLGMRDCWSCMRKDGALDATIAALTARSASRR